MTSETATSGLARQVCLVSLGSAGEISGQTSHHFPSPLHEARAHGLWPFEATLFAPSLVGTNCTPQGGSGDYTLALSRQKSCYMPDTNSVTWRRLQTFSDRVRHLPLKRVGHCEKSCPWASLPQHVVASQALTGASELLGAPWHLKCWATNRAQDTIDSHRC